MFDLSVETDNAEAGVTSEDIRISDYEMLEMSDIKLIIQLYFEYPQSITENVVDPDQLVIKFKLGTIFIDEEDFTRLDEELKMTVSIP